MSDSGFQRSGCGHRLHKGRQEEAVPNRRRAGAGGSGHPLCVGLLCVLQPAAQGLGTEDIRLHAQCTFNLCLFYTEKHNMFNMCSSTEPSFHLYMYIYIFTRRPQTNVATTTSAQSLILRQD